MSLYYSLTFSFLFNFCSPGFCYTDSASWCGWDNLNVLNGLIRGHRVLIKGQREGKGKVFCWRAVRGRCLTACSKPANLLCTNTCAGLPVADSLSADVIWPEYNLGSLGRLVSGKPQQDSGYRCQ